VRSKRGLQGIKKKFAAAAARPATSQNGTMGKNKGGRCLGSRGVGGIPKSKLPKSKKEGGGHRGGLEKEIAPTQKKMSWYHHKKCFRMRKNANKLS